MRRMTLASTCCLALGLALAGCQDATEDLEFFQATLRGSEEVPPAATGNTGAVGFTFDGATVTYSLEFENVSDITMAHIHSGVPGINGPSRVFLYRGPPASTTGKRILAQGSFTQADLIGISMSDLLSQMRAGTAYANIHTATTPVGRGQIGRLDVD